MGLADDLWKLQEMHQRGELTDDEYAQAKAAVLGRSSSENAPMEELTRQMDEVARRQEVADIDRAWDREREQYMASGTSGGTHDAHGNYVGGTPYRYIPTRGGSVGVGIFATIAGFVWMIFAAGIGAGAFALFGLVFIAFGICIAVFNYNKAVRHEDAHARYRQRRRKALLGEDDGPFQNEPLDQEEQPPGMWEGR